MIICWLQTCPGILLQRNTRNMLTDISNLLSDVIYIVKRTANNRSVCYLLAWFIPSHIQNNRVIVISQNAWILWCQSIKLKPFSIMRQVEFGKTTGALSNSFASESDGLKISTIKNNANNDRTFIFEWILIKRINIYI